jgi:hypothetical protein
MGDSRSPVKCALTPLGKRYQRFVLLGFQGLADEVADL